MAMAKQEGNVGEITMSSTKKEMLAAYNELVKRLEEEREAEMKPEQRVREKQDREALEVAASLSLEGIGKEVGNLKAEIGKMLGQLSDKMEEEIAKYVRTKKAVEVKERELAEIYEIEKSASTLAALIEAQKEKREQFESEMARQKEAIGQEIRTTREAWEQEEEAHKSEIAERQAAEKKARERDAEEYKYQFAREKQQATEQFEYEKTRLEREVQLKKEEMEKDLSAREKALKEREAELSELRQRVAAFPKDMQAAVEKAVSETADRLNREAQAREAVIAKDAEAEQKVLNSRIESLQQAVREQGAQIARLSEQLEKSYGQVQDIAVKAIEGSSNAKAFASLQRQASEPPRRPGQGED